MESNMKTIRSGVYSIVCNSTGEFYIGSTTYLKRRWSQHLTTLRDGTHHNKNLQSLYNRVGPQALSFQTLESIEDNYLTDRENYYLESNKDNPLMLNIMVSTSAPKDLTYRQSLSAKMSNHKRTTEHKQNFYEAHVRPIKVETPTEVLYFDSIKNAAAALDINWVTLRAWMSGNGTQPSEQSAPKTKYKHLVDHKFSYLT